LTKKQVEELRLQRALDREIKAAKEREVKELAKRREEEEYQRYLALPPEEQEEYRRKQRERA
jgi:cytidylate kinase